MRAGTSPEHSPAAKMYELNASLAPSHDMEGEASSVEGIEGYFCPPALNSALDADSQITHPTSFTPYGYMDYRRAARLTI